MLHYSTRGDPCLPPLIFLHGFLGSKEDWRGFLPFFEEKYHCICVDLPGHGQSAYCENIIEKIQEFSRAFQDPIFIGYSMGARIAMQLHLSAKKLVILSGHLGLTSHKEKLKRQRLDKAWSQRLLSTPFATFLKAWYAQPLFQPLPDSLDRSDNNPELLAQVVVQMSLGHQDHCKGFACPTLFLYGENDLKYRDLYCRLPKNCAVEQIQGCGHMIHLANPPLCAEKILNWLESS